MTNLENPNELQENSFNQELEGLEKDIKANHSEDDSKWRERSSVPREMRSVLLKYEGKSNLSDAEFKTYIGYINKYKTHADFRNLTKITDYQAAEIAKKSYIDLDNLTSITDKQAELLGKAEYLVLNGLKSITDKQAELLSKDTKSLRLVGLSHITDKQAELLGKAGELALNGLKSITNKQAELLSNVRCLGINKNILTPQQKRIILDKKDYLINTTEDNYGGYTRREFAR